MKLWSTTAPVAFACFSLIACGGGNERSPAHSSKITADTQQISAQANSEDTSVSPARVGVVLENPPPNGVYIGIEYSQNALAYVQLFDNGPENAELQMEFHSPRSMGSGTFQDSVILSVCYDADCNVEVDGSPLLFQVQLVVAADNETQPTPTATPGPAANPVPAVPAAVFDEQNVLPHDVIDAEYSAALDAVVMVSGYPSNALYILDPVTGNERSVALNKPPTSISISPNGLSAAVGHDALISVVGLQSLATVHSVKVLNVAIEVLDVVHGGNGYVYGFPTRDQWSNIHAVEIATNVETAHAGRSIYAGTIAKLHPSGTKMYGADNGVSPSDIERYDVTAGLVTYDYDSPYHGDYAMCGNLWMHEQGLHIYTACGNVLRSSDVREQDMVYNGRLALYGSESGYNRDRIVHLSHSNETKRIFLIEENWFDCGYEETSCDSFLSTFESDFLNLIERRWLAPIEVAGNSYKQRGLFAFQSGDGSQMYTISRLAQMPNPNAEYYWGRLN